MQKFRHFMSHWKKVKTDSNKLAAIQKRFLYCNYAQSFEGFSIFTRKSDDFKLKTMESLLIVCGKPAPNKVDSALPLQPFWYKISGYHMIFYHIMWCPFIPMYIHKCRLFRFQYYIRSFNTLSNGMCGHMGNVYHFRHDHESSGFQKLVENKWTVKPV